MTQVRRSTPLTHGCDAPHACPQPLRMEVLGKTPYFAGLGLDQLADIDRQMRVRGYSEDETIYRSGDPANHLFILAAGRVKVLRPSLDRTDVLVEVVTPGAMFGSVAALGSSTYPDTARALTVSCALRISASDFRAVLHQHPDVALTVLDDVASRLERAHQAVGRVTGGTVEQRVASTLLTLADKLGEPRGDSVLLQMPLSREDLAAMTGTTTESVSRAMSTFRRRGLIDTGRRWTAVIDAAGLGEVARG